MIDRRTFCQMWPREVAICTALVISIECRRSLLRLLPRGFSRSPSSSSRMSWFPLLSLDLARRIAIDWCRVPLPRNSLQSLLQFWNNSRVDAISQVVFYGLIIPSWSHVVVNSEPSHNFVLIHHNTVAWLAPSKLCECHFRSSTITRNPCALLTFACKRETTIS